MRCLDFTQCPRRSVSCWVHNCSTKGAKVVKLNPKKEALDAENRATLEMDLEWAHKDTAYRNLLCVIADICDSAASGSDSFLSIGTTRDKSAITLMVQVEGQRQSLYDVTLRGLDELCETLL